MCAIEEKRNLALEIQVFTNATEMHEASQG